MEKGGEKKNEEKPGKIARDYQVINDTGKYCTFLSFKYLVQKIEN